MGNIFMGLYADTITSTDNMDAELVVFADTKSGHVSLRFTILSPNYLPFSNRSMATLEEAFALFNDQQFLPWREAAFAVRDDPQIVKKVSLLQMRPPTARGH